MSSRRHFLSTLSAGAAGVSIPAHPFVAAGDQSLTRNVTDFGAVGDGKTPCGDAFQQAIDAAEAQGGGIVFIPPGRFILEKTPLIASMVHVTGSGASTILEGPRPDDNPGAALISNKGQQAPGYSGARDWSISHLAIDTPRSNGIVVTHAQNVYIGHIYGINTYNHFVDAVGKNILCENLFLTGRSGTSSFQVDALSGAQTIWDGEKRHAPLYDGTDAKDVILRNSIITAIAGHEGTRPHHNVSIHFHGDEADGFTFSDMIIGGAETGFYQDEGSRYHNIRISNITSYNPGRAGWFCPGEPGQENLSIHGLLHRPGKPSTVEPAYRGLSIHGKTGLTLSDITLVSPAGLPCRIAVEIEACEKLFVQNIKATGEGGYGILLRDRIGMENTRCRYGTVQHCILEGFSDGIGYDKNHNGGPLTASGNLFVDVENPYFGDIDVKGE